MEAFINERSAHEQCQDSKGVNRLVLAFVQILDRLAAYQKRDQHWLGPDFVLYQMRDIRTECVLLLGGGQGSLERSITDRQLRGRLYDALGRLRPNRWTEAQQHRAEVKYTCQGELENGTSLAELAERLYRRRDLPCFMMNFGECRFSASKQIEVDREESANSRDTIALDAIERLETLEEWAAARRYIPCPYPPLALDPPRDDQTILVDASRFERTGRRVQGRKVYRERISKRLWYVDNLHYGARAELEVFDASGRHIGIANIHGVVDESRQKPGRHIDRL